jgi:endoglycosylceramidase
VYTLLDFHQDNLADEFCGEGLPSWVVNASGAPGFPVPIERAPYPVNASTGFPSPDDCARHPWAVYQFSAAQCRAYQNLYDNAGGAADALGGFWATLAGAFNASTSVLGYELMNEPWVGDLFAKPQLIVPGHADRENLAPFYERLHAAIRTQDAQHIVMFEAITFDDFVPVGFQAVPGGDAYRNRSALSFHYYDAPNLNRVLDFSTRKRDIARLGCGGMLTEFGTCADSDAATDLAAIARTCDFADAALLSWAGWEYKSFVEITGFCNGLFFANGSVNTPLATTLARPYAKAVAGRTLVMAFNATTREFTLRYAARNDSTLPTVVALNGELVYPGGAFAVEFDPDPAACQLVPPQPPFAPEPWHFVVLCGPQLRDGDEIGLRVSPKE